MPRLACPCPGSHGRFTGTQTSPFARSERWLQPRVGATACGMEVPSPREPFEESREHRARCHCGRASAGGILAVIEVLSRLPADLPAFIGVVIHRGASMS